VQRRAHGVDRAGSIPGQELQRDQRRTAARGALVVEPAREQLDLLAEAKLPDGAVGDGARAVVAAPRVALDLVVPLPAEIREAPLVTRLREGVGLGRCLGEGQDGAPVSERGAGPT
jgi:hypothetical protein